MKKHCAMPQIFNYLSAVLLLVQPGAAIAAVELVDNLDIAWTFQPAGSAERYKLNYLTTPLVQDLPKTSTCCSGTYEGKLIGTTLGALVEKSNIQFPTLHFPAVNGLKTISINGEVIFKRENGDYGSSGPIVSLSKEHLAAKQISILVEVEHLKSYFAGFWWLSHRLMLGNYDSLQSAREVLLIRQKYLPLFWTYLFLIMAPLLIWLAHSNGDPDRKLYIFLEVTLLWALFYYALSGELRRIAPYWGGYLHFPLRSLAGLSSVRLLMVLSNCKNLEIRAATLIGLSSIFCGAGLSWNGDHRWQQIGFIFITLEFIAIYFLIVFYQRKTKSNDPIYKFLVISGALLIISSALDVASALGGLFFHYRSPLLSLNRYLGPPFILGSIVYITQRASMQESAEKSRNLIEKMSEQLLHDLRSPATAIRNVALSSNQLDQEQVEKEILTSASERIISMCRTLITKDSVTDSQETTDVLGALKNIISEKKIEWKNPDSVQICHGLGTFSALVDKHDFKRIISNILNNSYEANPNNPKIEISLKMNRKFIQIHISDNCGGIKQEILKDINAGRVKSTKISGRGIGLLNARETVLKWKGKFSIRSKTGIGTTIELSIARA